MRNKYAKKPVKSRGIVLPILVSVLTLCIIGTAVFLISPLISQPSAHTSSDDVGHASSAPSEPYVVSTATVVNTGDLLMHSPIISGAKNSDGSYDFSDIFSVIKPYLDAADLSVANLEITFGGEESGAYSGYPCFNLPDSFADDIKNGGIDFLLTANNHCYDTGLFGLKRTAQTLKTRNIPFIGTRESEQDSIYTVRDVNGIKIGMACYTYENARPEAGRKSINGRVISVDANNLISSFAYEALDEFYLDAQETIAAMRQGGAECIVFYMHWGEEYRLAPNNWQTTIAQKLCDLGADVIVGGHPHVIQPMELLTSSDGTHSTVCIYSMGNAVSNQRKGIMTSCPSGHTEDGMLFYYTFRKYSDGKVSLASVDVVPTWVEKKQINGKNKYVIYPLKAADNAQNTDISADDRQSAEASLARTDALINSGLQTCIQYLESEIRFVSTTPVESAEK